MHCIARARADLDLLPPLVLFEAGRQDDVLILDGAGRRHLERLGHFKDRVRWTHVPSLRPPPFDRAVFRVALRSTAGGPRCDGVDLALRKRPVVREMPKAWVSKPGRHLTRHDGLPDGLGPRAGLLIRQQWHGPDLTGPVTLLAGALENRQNVPIERGGGK